MAGHYGKNTGPLRCKYTLHGDEWDAFSFANFASFAVKSFF